MKSKSFSFAKDIRNKTNKLKTYIWNGNKVYYRTGSSDMSLIYEILLKSKEKSEYFFPKQINPKVILDIGGNIGIASIYLASIFPEAAIYTFEPLHDNFKILKKNTQQYTNIKIFNIGLGSKNGNFKVYLSDNPDNFGGASFYPEIGGNKDESYIKCEVKNINEVLKELKLNSIDLIKIDTEGAEYDILYTLKGEILRDTSWITGELHGNQDFELLNYLNSLGFSISLKKEIDNRLSIFHAGKPEIISQLSRKEIKIF
jgi:FkbM family methyltransferase